VIADKGSPQFWQEGAFFQREQGVLPPTVNYDNRISEREKREAGERTSSWVPSPYFSVFPASPSPDKLIGS
jgi:hypothetical protein